MRKKYFFIIIFIFIFLLTLIHINVRVLSMKMPLYKTAFKEINLFLNKEHQNLNTNNILSKNLRNDIVVNVEGDKVQFFKDSFFSNKSKDFIQYNYKTDYQFISVLKVFKKINILSDIDFSEFEYSEKGNYYVDELKNPIVIMKTNFNPNTKIDFIYCNNLKNNISRNYAFYDSMNNSDKYKIHYTRANEIFFDHNNYFFYIGTDMDLSNSDAIMLVNTILNNEY